MKLLLDECVPHRLRNYLTQHDVHSSEHAGFAGIGDGKVLELIQGQFDVLITIDQNLIHQNNVAKYDVGVILVIVGSSELHVIREKLDQINDALKRIKKGQVIIVD